MHCTLFLSAFNCNPIQSTTTDNTQKTHKAHGHTFKIAWLFKYLFARHDQIILSKFLCTIHSQNRILIQFWWGHTEENNEDEGFFKDDGALKNIYSVQYYLPHMYTVNSARRGPYISILCKIKCIEKYILSKMHVHDLKI